SHPRGPVVFDFRPGRSRDGPRQFLAGFRGILQTDGYAAYEQLGGPEIVLAACWARGALWARRKFYEAAKLAPRELLPARIVAGIDELFRIDAEARAQGLDLAQRHALRRQRAPAVLAEVRRRIEQARGEALPASALGRAVAYALAQWPKLVRFLEYPELELSNNLAENAIRPVALGRKNWLHLGSPEAGAKIAVILSVLATCRRLRIDLRAYLLDVLPRLADTSIRKVAELTPTAWSAQRR
ncbi:MAG: IS66 family transposase, partial [Candidatus Hadarchaeum sp.]